MKNPPFFYKVSFHFLAQEPDNELKHESWQKEFHNTNPFNARDEAFEAFEEYFRYLEINKKIKRDMYGNPIIINPSGIPKQPEFPERLDKIETEEVQILWHDYASHIIEFEETMDVLLVITDDSLVEDFGYGDSTLAIHSVSSHSVYKQQMLDNLTTEIDLYRKFNYSLNDKTVTIQHFGEDYAESDEEDGAENYNMLPTPFNWTTKEQYENWKQKNDSTRELPEQNIWERILKKGESNSLEFKPSLIYNFLPASPNHLPLFNNARTICGFLNSNGGILLIGISDNGVPKGIDKDLKFLGSKDKIRLEVDNILPRYFSNALSPLVEVSFEIVQQIEFLVIKVKPSNKPIFLRNYNPITKIKSKHFFVRRSASTTEIKDVEDIINYIFNNWR